jgi:KaiC/GvpD/RAD55 family RecA-like ATPase
MVRVVASVPRRIGSRGWDPGRRRPTEEIRANLIDRLHEAREQGWLGEVAAIEASLAATE